MANLDDPIEIRRMLQGLASLGKHINRSEREILVTCYDQRYSINELADMLKMGYGGAYKHVKNLERMNLLEVAYREGRESYYTCRFDLSATADYTYRFRIRKENLTFEQLLFYLYANEPKVYSRQIMDALIFLYMKSKRRSENLPVDRLSGMEVKSSVLAMCDQLQDWIVQMRTLTEGVLFTQTENCHELYGPIEGEFMKELFGIHGTSFRNHWTDKSISTKGLSLNRPKDRAQSGKDEFNDDHNLRLTDEGWGK